MHKEGVVAITGASAGVGRATARAFAREGFAVGLIARGLDGLEGARRDVQSAGARAVAVSADVADAEKVESAAGEIEEALGPIDVWVNNAMVSVFSPVRQMTAEEFRRVTEVTYLGYVHGTLSALRRMLSRDQGVIVQVGSALSYRAIPLQSAYCAAKHAVEGFTESLRCELLHDESSVRVTTVHLPALNTPQFDWVRVRLPNEPQPVPPIYQPEVAADAIVWAARHPEREFLVGGSTVLAVEGNKLAPALGDQYLARTGYKAQQTERPVRPDRQDNLFAPVPGDHGARGSFSDRAYERSYYWSLSKRGGWWAPLAVAAGAAGSAALLLRRLRSSGR